MFHRLPILAFFCVLLTGCATQSYSPDNAPEMSVIREFSALYKLGPMQGRGPDTTLRVGTRVKLLRKEMGYSLVMMEDSRTGYMANEDLVPAPPRPPKPPESGLSMSDTNTGGRSRPSGQRYRGEQVNDSPLPESAPPPELDLNIGLEDIAAPPKPVPSGSPSGTPKFRY